MGLDKLSFIILTLIYMDFINIYRPLCKDYQDKGPVLFTIDSNLLVNSEHRPDHHLCFQWIV